MTDPTTAAAAVKQGVITGLPLAALAGTILGVPLDFIAAGFFGGLVAEAKAEPRPPLPSQAANAGRLAVNLAIAAGLGGWFAYTGADVVVALASKIGIPLNDDELLQRASAIVIGFGTRFLPEAIRIVQARFAPKGGQNG